MTTPNVPALTAEEAARAAKLRIYKALVEPDLALIKLDQAVVHYNTVQNQLQSALTELIQSIGLYIVTTGQSQIQTELETLLNNDAKDAATFVPNPLYDKAAISRDITSLQSAMRQPGTIHHVHNAIKVCRKYKLLYKRAADNLVAIIEADQGPQNLSTRMVNAGFPANMKAHIEYQFAKADNLLRQLSMFNRL